MIETTLIKLTRQLYPTGRAFKMPFGGTFEQLHKGLILSEARAYNDAIGILNAVLPDNENFTIEDARDWERRLALITNESVSLEDRKAAIRRKIQFPGQQPARQHYLFMQGQLQLAGFDVYVYENIFYPGPTTKTPQELGVSVPAFQHGQKRHGQIKHGGGFSNKVVNHVEESLDANFDVGATLRSTFFIGGNPLGTFANVPIARKDEFRQLILKLKRAQTCAYLFINYV